MQTPIAIACLIITLLVIAHFVHHPREWGAIQAFLSALKHWLTTTYISNLFLCVYVLVGLCWLISIPG